MAEKEGKKMSWVSSDSDNTTSEENFTTTSAEEPAIQEYTDKTKNGKDIVALFVALIFVLGLGLFAYRYFNQVSNSQNTSSASTVRVDLDATVAGTSTDESAESENGGSSEQSSAQATESVFGQWIATDYKKGDIQPGQYEVQEGDTLWEIAEAVYGDGAEWGRILAANTDQVGFLGGGQQALIVTGQILIIPI